MSELVSCEYEQFKILYFITGLMISGAISLAVNEINNSGKLKNMGHSLKFKVAETYGEEVSSIRQTAALWTDKVFAYIGPQETCIHEGRMAAAFNLPMISYVSSIDSECVEHIFQSQNHHSCQFLCYLCVIRMRIFFLCIPNIYNIQILWTLDI